MQSELTHAERKEYPMFSGLLKYFPDALAEVAHLSKVGNDQHNPGKPLHWDRSKSTDELDALMRHLSDAGTLDSDGERHSTKVAWRALANLQKELEAARGDARSGPETALGEPLAIEDEILPEESLEAPPAPRGLAQATFDLGGLGEVHLSWWQLESEGNTSDLGAPADAIGSEQMLISELDPDEEPVMVRRTSEDAPRFQMLSAYKLDGA